MQKADNLPSSPSTSSVMASTSLCWQYVPVSQNNETASSNEQPQPTYISLMPVALN